jgi:hypothetical protein
LELSDFFKYDSSLKEFLVKSFNAVDSEGCSVVEKFKVHVCNLPAMENERLTRYNLLPSSQVDTTHPPTVLRQKFVAQLAELLPQITLDETASTEIDNELKPIMGAISEKLVTH